MAPRLDESRFLEDVTGRHARFYRDALADLVVAEATGDREFRAGARERLGDVVTETFGVGEVLGASSVLRGAARERSREARLAAERPRLLAFADAPTQSVLPRVTFEEAVEDMVERTPVTIRRAAERTAARIRELYGEGRVVAFVESAEAAVTERVQDLLADALREGIGEAEGGRLIVREVNLVRDRTRAWTEGYARMAFRTNLNTAVTAGRFRQVADPDVREVIPGFRFDAVGDDDTRPNHLAADGVVLQVDNPAWARLATPLGYN